MVRMLILYPRTPDAQFNLDYYLKTHIELVRSSFSDAVPRISVYRGLDGPDGKPAPFLVSATIEFRDMSSLLSAIQRHGTKIAQDVVNFTTIRPTIQIEESVT